MPIETQVSENNPMLIAWNKYKASDEYQNSRNWAKHEEHVDGSMWASFVIGWNASGEEKEEKHA